MNRYVIFPKQGNVTDAVASLDAAVPRQDKLAAMQSARADHDWYDAVQERIAELYAAKKRRAAQVCGQVSGAWLVDLDEDEVAHFDELDDVDVLADIEISLDLPPQADLDGSESDSVTDADLWHQEMVGLLQARAAGFEATGEDVLVAVLDTGIDATHPSLAGRVARSVVYDEDATAWVDQDTATDTDEHGTHVAGLVCGSDVGVAPGARLVNVTMLPGRRGKLSEFLLAMDWLALSDEPVQIVNISAGLDGFFPQMQASVDAMLALGMLPVCAVGNEFADSNRSPGNLIKTLSVGAVTSSRKVAPFSGGGTLVVTPKQWTVPDLVAPGDGVVSCIPGGKYKAKRGSSMATPIVSGIAALLASTQRLFDPQELREAVLTTCVDLGLAADRQGKGLIKVTV